MANFTEDQLAQLKTALQERYLALQEEVQNELAHTNDIRDPELVEYLNDTPDDIDTALIDRQINEMRELEMSLEYLNELEFGDCIDCGNEIGFERLLAYPSAQRCIQCQSKYEKAFPQESSPSL
ncbi:MAG: TraR/DksA family transcriptional regulator [Nitrosomonas sp.]|uniref:TraR/DksA family transcriptional regulator n=1 Tax=Nitrosomonas oligotropha TaxID=42354 RepID=UPI000D44C075|nr:TraR/DksA family transcriptional regulator [Nitrosomonas oligotropha]MBL8499963.1 TraR/DksA family transcriptional regulator [Nitrosomonas sp.]MCG7755478.1 TraR/DksA family transcriptional regulator [Nitrosomonas sp.]MXS82172.1 TraR/DksA family transcriptional regulator [Nitrosomonas oligotropha]UJP00486.1 MAG: TraR/DksA family transcriptional regulator [Nitrosomonas sp.]